MATPQALTFLGLGNMGSALVQALLKASHKVTIWNRTADRPQVKAAVEAGAALEVDVQSAISRNSIIVICLLDYSSIKTALAGISTTALERKIIVNLTNGTPKQAREMAAWASSQSLKHYFDGAVMVPPQMIGGPQSFVVASGETFEAFKPIASLLEPVGRPEYLGTAIDAAARYDLAALSSMYGMFSGILNLSCLAV
ncbi:hypothetical protein Neosp_013545 [[Neocosmospora] mangrovei]